MIIDFHTHIFPKDIRRNRAKYFPKDSAFKLLYDSPKAKLVGVREIVEAMNEEGVDKSVVFGFPWKNMEIAKFHNDYIMAAVTKYPDRLIGFCCLDPFHDGAAMETERCLTNGLAGLGELAFYEAGIDAETLNRLEPLMKICLQKDVPVLIHTNEPVGHSYPGKSPNTLMQIYSLVQRYAAQKLVLAHWGGGIFLYGLLKKEVKENLKNVYFDTAASPFLYDADIWEYAKKLAGPDKILFGTDYPLIKPVRYFEELKTTGLSTKEIKDICGGNAMRVLRL
ncbi:amidohydrolase family protein [Thermodesulfobacteriota bacterium]